MTLATFSLSLEEVKNYLKVEHNLEDDYITDLIQASIEEAANYLNRDWEPGEYPAAVKMDILRLIAWHYDNRGDTTAGLPSIPLPGLNQYRLLPGL